jgi:hypothetical protein
MLRSLQTTVPASSQLRPQAVAAALEAAEALVVAVVAEVVVVAEDTVSLLPLAEALVAVADVEASVVSVVGVSSDVLVDAAVSVLIPLSVSEGFPVCATSLNFPFLSKPDFCFRFSPRLAKRHHRLRLQVRRAMPGSTYPELRC